MNRTMIATLVVCGVFVAGCGPTTAPIINPPTGAVAPSASDIANQARNGIQQGCDILADVDPLISLVPYFGTADKIAGAVCKAVKALPASKAQKVPGAPVYVRVICVLVTGHLQ